MKSTYRFCQHSQQWRLIVVSALLGHQVKDILTATILTSRHCGAFLDEHGDQLRVA